MRGKDICDIDRLIESLSLGRFIFKKVGKSSYKNKPQNCTMKYICEFMHFIDIDGGYFIWWARVLWSVEFDYSTLWARLMDFVAFDCFI